MRVISGTAKGHPLKAAGAATRPITDRVKENLFNILGARIIDARVLDLFAGAGSVGIEALSRGARAATFVEVDRAALAAIRTNLETTRLADRARIVRRDVFRFLRDTPEPYDVIYAAPPQYQGLWMGTLTLLDQGAWLSENGIIIVQIHPKEYKALALTQLELFDQRKYGSTMLCFYRRASGHKSEAAPSSANSSITSSSLV